MIIGWEFLSRRKKISVVRVQAKPKEKFEERPLDPWEKTMLGYLPLELRRNMEEIRKHESTINSKLQKNKELRDLFLIAPGEAIAKMGIHVDPVIRKSARISDPNELFRGYEITLHSGKRIKPVVNITIKDMRRRET